MTQNIRLRHPLIALSCVIAWLSTAASIQGSEKFTSVGLRLKWHHQFQSAGYYMAAHKGFYRKQDIEVIITEAQESDNVVNLVLSGNTEFAIGSSAIVIDRLKGKSIVALAAIFQRSPLVFVTQDSKNIKSVADLSGQNVMMEPGAEELLAYLKNSGVEPGSLNVLPRNDPLVSFKTQSIAAFTAYTTDELFYLQRDNIPCKVFAPDLDGGAFYSDILFTSQEMLEKSPAVVRAFRKASLQGWEYAFSNVDETIRVIEEKYGVTKGKEALQFEAAHMQSLVEEKSGVLGDMSRARWNTIGDYFIRAEMAPQGHDLHNFVYGATYRSRGRWSYALIGGIVAMFVLSVLILLSDAIATKVKLRYGGKRK